MMSLLMRFIITVLYCVRCLLQWYKVPYNRRQAVSEASQVRSIIVRHALYYAVQGLYCSTGATYRRKKGTSLVRRKHPPAVKKKPKDVAVVPALSTQNMYCSCVRPEIQNLQYVQYIVQYCTSWENHKPLSHRAQVTSMIVLPSHPPSESNTSSLQ